MVALGPKAADHRPGLGCRNSCAQGTEQFSTLIGAPRAETLTSNRHLRKDRYGRAGVR